MERKHMCNGRNFDFVRFRAKVENIIYGITHLGDGIVER